MSDQLELESPLADPAAEPVADTRCPCGSGLKQRHCCGLDLSTVERTFAEGLHAEPVSIMSRAFAAGDLETVREVALEVLETAPAQRDALAALYNVLVEDKRFEPAGIIVDRLALLYPNDPQLRATAAFFFLGRGDRARGARHARMLVRMAPHASIAHVMMGRVFSMGQNATAAEHHFRRAIALAADETPTPEQTRVAPGEVAAYLGIALREQGRLDEARAIFARVTEEQGPKLMVLLAWIALEESARDFDAAHALLDRAEALAPGGKQLAVVRAGLQRRVNRPVQALATLDALIESAADDPDGATGGLLQKGQVLDSLGRYDEAFAAVDAFKRRWREQGGLAYQADRANALVAGLRDFFTEGRARLLPRATTRADSPQPIFIIGFPRSGTTLVEQTLSAHPQIAAGDELPIINEIAARSHILLGSPGQYPLSLSELWLGDRLRHIDVMRDVYLSEAAQIGAIDPARRWFTDKMPLNETHLGLISLLFPASPVIHLVRHPLDVVLSVFSNGLTHGFNCAGSLETAARHYALIADLIADYRAAMPIHYHAVRYEDLVTDQEREVRAMFAFVGESFEPRTLNFHTNTRPARTASHAQVTEKLYDRSRYRYRHYLKHLEPVIPILAPAIDRLGYTIERRILPAAVASYRIIWRRGLRDIGVTAARGFVRGPAIGSGALPAVRRPDRADQSF